MQTPVVSRIRIYPVKSLDQVELHEAEVGIHSLRYDREFAMVTDDGRFVNGKRTGKVNQLKATYDLTNQLIHLAPRAGGATNTFHLINDTLLIEKYLREFFELPIRWIHRTRGELMDIPMASSITVVSEASLLSLQDQIKMPSLENMRLRFRATIELRGVAAFWEENLFGNPGTGIRFKLADVEMIGVSPRARCNVPPRDPFTGETDKSFVRAMVKSRTSSLPDTSTLPLYGNFYHLTVNTYLPETETGKKIRVGDTLTIIDHVRLSDIFEQ
jgi:uncharacterized protein YcbX